MQIPSYNCPVCNGPVGVGKRFCPNCGTAMNITPVAPTLPASSEFPGSTMPIANGYPNPTMPNIYPPIQDANTPSTAYPYPHTQYPQQGSGTAPYNTGMPTLQPPNVSSLPDYAMPKPRSRKKLFIILGIVLLALVLVGGLCSWAAIISVNSLKHSSGGLGGTIAPGNSTPEQLNTTVTYSGVDMTMNSIQQADKFSDDTSSTYAQQPGVVRVNFKEQNKSTSTAFYIYNEAFLLVLPDGSTVKPVKAQNDGDVGSGVIRTNWVDFPVPQKADLSQLVLRVGTLEEAQMDIPLKLGANVGKYQPKTFPLNTKITYGGVNFTMVNATTSLSIGDQQAKKGMRIVSIDLKGTNTGDNEFFAPYTGNYLLLQSGSTSTGPTTSTEFNAPDLIHSQDTKEGIVSFEVPQNTTSFTLVFRDGTNIENNPIAKQNVSLQIP